MNILLQKRKQIIKAPNYRYRIFRQKLHSEELGKYYTYGIKCTSHITSLVNDVGTDRALVKRIAQRLNRNNTEPSELLDTIESLL